MTWHIMNINIINFQKHIKKIPNIISSNKHLIDYRNTSKDYDRLINNVSPPITTNSLLFPTLLNKFALTTPTHRKIGEHSAGKVSIFDNTSATGNVFTSAYLRMSNKRARRRVSRGKSSGKMSRFSRLSVFPSQRLPFRCCRRFSKVSCLAGLSTCFALLNFPCSELQLFLTLSLSRAPRHFRNKRN